MKIETSSEEKFEGQTHAARETAPLSFAQQRLWFLHHLHPDGTSYNVLHMLDLPAAVDVELLGRVFSEIVRRHEILRTRFVVRNNQPLQQIDAGKEISIREIDLCFTGEAERKRRLDKIISDEAAIPFDLSGSELFRLTLVYHTPRRSVLLMSVHHIIIDGWSVNVLNREIKILCEAFLNGKSSPLNDLPVQYADFSVWQRNTFSGERLKAQLDFWRTQLSDIPDFRFPDTRMIARGSSHKGLCKTFVVSRTIYSRLKKCSSRLDCTLFVTLLAAFKVLLFRYSGQEDIVVGCPVSGRIRSEFEPLIGFFVNTLVLRTKFDGNDSFEDVVQKTREVFLEAFAHQDVPFEKLVEELHATRDAGRNPLFQVIFQLLTGSKEDVGANDDTVQLEMKATTSKFDLTLSMNESDDRLSGSLEYNTDVFLPRTIERLAGHYLNILQAVADQPAVPVAQLNFLLAAERTTLLEEWNNTGHDYDARVPVHELFALQAAKAGESVALFNERSHMSYSELDQLSNQWSHFFVGLGIGPEHMVIVCMERSFQMVAVHLGILKAGAAFVPLDPSYPDERLALLIGDVGATYAIVDNFLSLPSLVSLQQLVVKDKLHLIRDMPQHAPQIKIRPENRAYMMYTSGSTGKPKGVEICHSGLTNLVHWNCRAYALTNKDRCLQMATPAYDAYIFELFPCLVAGASAYLIDDVTRTSAEQLRDAIIRQHITTAFLPTALGEVVSIGPWPERISLRILSTGGEKMMRAPQVALAFQYLNFYGPTENTVMTTCCPVPVNSKDVLPPIGRPIDNVELYVLDQYLSPVPVGVTGELYIGGQGVARGYYHRPALTAEKFIPDPFSSRPGSRLYKTSDLVRYRADGNLDFVGRLDHQIKLRGFRIELEEIEKVLRKHPQIREAVVTLAEVGNAGKSIVAYLAVQERAMMTEETIRDFIKKKLPVFMVPGKMIFLAELPKSMNGKVDRKKLPLPVPTVPSPDHAARHGAHTAMEELITGVWQEFLPVQHISVQENFFDLGGHSLLMAQVHQRMKETMQKDINLIDLFQYPTIRSLAKHLEKMPDQVSVKKTNDDRASKQRQTLFQHRANQKKV